MAMRSISHFLAIAGTMLLVACPAEAAPHSYTVIIDNMKFGPVPQQLHKGDAIVWNNRDMLRHSATASDHSFDADLQPGAKVRTVLTKAGAISFVCRYHPGMHGVLHVR